MTTLSNAAIQIKDALLRRHAQKCIYGNSAAAITDQMIAQCTITYSQLHMSVMIDVPLPSIGEPLDEIANWCYEHGFKPLNALAVENKRRRPSPGYEEAPGCGEWYDDIRKCVAFHGYPSPTRIDLSEMEESMKKTSTTAHLTPEEAFSADLLTLSRALLKVAPILGRDLEREIEQNRQLQFAKTGLSKNTPGKILYILVNHGLRNLAIECLALRYRTLFTPRHINHAEEWLQKVT